MEQPTYLPRHVDAELAAALRTSPIVLLDGPRAAGKTTSARRLAASTVMLPRDLSALHADPEGYLRSLPTPVLIDEWQLAGTSLLWTIKGLVDEDPAPGRFLLTGSVEPTSYGPTYPLTGRSARLVMRPMTVAELDGRGKETTFLDGILSGAQPRSTAGGVAAFDLSWLTRPGFPAARDLSDPRYFLDAYSSVVSERAGEEGRDSTRLLRAMRVLAALTGQALPDQRIWDAADINKATWRQYDDLLLRAHLSAPLAAFESNRLKRLTGYPKRFLSDTALALALADVEIGDLRSDPGLAGPFLESFVLQQLRPQVDRVGGSLAHVRTAGGEREVDVVIEVGPRLYGVEVKLGSRPGPRESRHLDWFREVWGTKFGAGFVIHTGADTYPLGDGIWAVPVEVLTGAAGAGSARAPHGVLDGGP
ncbi:ATP-binding protein [Salana multivorans]